MHKVWLTNNQVAWEIPSGLIANCYDDGLYRPVKPWKVYRGKLPEGIRGFGNKPRTKTTVEQIPLYS